jgi:hypothetical protein
MTEFVNLCKDEINVSMCSGMMVENDVLHFYIRVTFNYVNNLSPKISVGKGTSQTAHCSYRLSHQILSFTHNNGLTHTLEQNFKIKTASKLTLLYPQINQNCDHNNALHILIIS